MSDFDFYFLLFWVIWFPLLIIFCWYQVKRDKEETRVTYVLYKPCYQVRVDDNGDFTLHHYMMKIEEGKRDAPNLP